MPRKLTVALLLIAVLLVVPVLTVAQDAPAPDSCAFVAFLNGWARATVAGMPTSAAYGFAVNLTETDDTLVSAATDAASVVELHEMTMGEGDVMMMNLVAGGIPVTARSLTELAPGGLHIMLIDLTQSLEAGDTLDLTLTFASGCELAVSVPIIDPATMDMEAQ